MLCYSLITMKALNWTNRVGTYNLGSSKRMQYESTLPEYFHNLTVIQQFFRCFNWVSKAIGAQV